MKKVKRNDVELTERGNAIFNEAIERFEKARANWERWVKAWEKKRKEFEDAKNKTP